MRTARSRAQRHHGSMTQHIALGVARDMKFTQTLHSRGVGSGWSPLVGAYAGTLVARALGGHVVSSRPRGAHVETMEGLQVAIGTAIGRRQRRFARRDFTELIERTNADTAVRVLFHSDDMRVLRAIRANRNLVEQGPLSSRVDGDDITEWLLQSADILERLPDLQDEDSLPHLTSEESLRIYAIDRIAMGGTWHWVEEVRSKRAYPYRQ